MVLAGGGRSVCDARGARGEHSVDDIEDAEGRHGCNGAPCVAHHDSACGSDADANSNNTGANPRDAIDNTRTGRRARRPKRGSHEPGERSCPTGEHGPEKPRRHAVNSVASRRDGSVLVATRDAGARDTSDHLGAACSARADSSSASRRDPAGGRATLSHTAEGCSTSGANGRSRDATRASTRDDQGPVCL